MKLYTAPEPVSDQTEEPANLFLAGSIEQDTASNWQQTLIKELAAYPVAVFNPRRDHWDPSWVQSAQNPEFAEQVNWELEQIWRADITFFYFEPGTMSPITLMELGFVAGRGLAEMFPVIVVCPDGFWRQGNVEIMCERAGFLFVKDLPAGIHVLKQAICDYTKTLAH